MYTKIESLSMCIIGIFVFILGRSFDISRTIKYIDGISNKFYQQYIKSCIFICTHIHIYILVDKK